VGITRKDFSPGAEPIERGLSTNRPAGPVEGRVRYETDTNQLVCYDGSTWNTVAVSVAAGYQPLDSDLTAIAALTTSAFGRGLLTSADAAALLASAGAQASDSDLTAIAALTTTAYGRAFLTLADQAALMALLSSATTTAEGKVELATSAETITGTDTTRAVTSAGAAAAYQPLDSDLTSIAAVATTAYGRAFLALANQAATMALLSAATTAASGISELATDAETITGTDTGRTVTPSNLTALFGDATWIEKVSDIVGTMVTGNTETGIAVTYQDSDNTVDYELDSAFLDARFQNNSISGATTRTVATGQSMVRAKCMKVADTSILQIVGTSILQVA
jgi:hypothetical protein